MTLNIERTRDRLQRFEFKALFIEELGWSRSAGANFTLPIQATSFTCTQIAQLGGVVVFEVQSSDGAIPDARTRLALHDEVSKRHHENLLIFVNASRTQSLWVWVKREDGKRYPRDHAYFKGQPGDLFLSKLGAMVVDISELDEQGDISVVDVAKRLKVALDVERATRRFYAEYDVLRLKVGDSIEGIPDERDRHWYASVVLNRLMFIWFLQKKFFLDGGDADYLPRKLAQSKARGADRFYVEFLKTLFFEGFAKPEAQRSAETKQLLGAIRYLNGGLFLPHELEETYHNIRIPDGAFEGLFRLFASYSWNLNDTPGGDDNEISPDVLGFIFEKYINQKEFGAYYTRPEITEYLCEQTIHRLILDAVNTRDVDPTGLDDLRSRGIKPHLFETIADLLMNLDAALCAQLLDEVLPALRLLDPACGSGAFLVAAMKTLINVYASVIGWAKLSNHASLRSKVAAIERDHPSLLYYIKKRIIADNLFGVDIMREAVEIAKLRLFLALVASATSVADLEPLPNIDFNILPGNSLIGLLRVDEAAFDAHLRDASASTKQASPGLKPQPEQLGLGISLTSKTYAQVLEEKRRLIRSYRHNEQFGEQLRELRDVIEAARDEAQGYLDEILLDQFQSLGVRFEQAIWDEKAGAEGRPSKRALTLADVRALSPFHWGYEFDEVMSKGGFDAIITNPPWEIFKPQAKEFFAQHSDLVTKNKMTIKEFEREQSKLLKDKAVRAAWLEYLSRFPHVSAYFRGAPQFANQIAIINGKKAGSDINLYKLLLEQCHNLLREGGYCGIVIPSGIYTDLGTKQLREMLFAKTRVTGLFCLENRREIFENVHRSYKIVVMSFRKGGVTDSFPAAFMRLDVAELDSFPQRGSLPISVELIRRLSPDSLSVMEFKSETDVRIAEKMLRFPQLGEKIEGIWNLQLARELDMTNDNQLFRVHQKQGLVPLVQGNMIHQFQHDFAAPKYWLDTKEARRRILGREEDRGQKLAYQDYRIAHRRIARSTDERSMIACVLPPNLFCADTCQSVRSLLPYNVTLLVCAVFNSFVVDSEIRRRISAHLDMHFVYGLRVPRLTAKDAAFAPIVERAARLICTTPEFDALWKEVMRTPSPPPLSLGERGELRAELDALVAHLYGLTEDEFTHILSTFPLVDQAVKDAALAKFREFAPNPDDAQLAALITGGESARLEFKIAAIWNPKTKVKDGTLKTNVIEEVAAFLNTEGGAVVIGVEDNGTVIGIADDVKTADPGKPNHDGYALFLRNALNDALGADVGPLCDITFHAINGVEVCRIAVKPSDRPVFVGGDLHIRSGHGKRKLSAREAIEYQKRRNR